MQVSDMRALKTFYSHRLRNLISHKPPSSLISCNKPPQNPNSPFPKPFHSTAHRRSSELDPTTTWINSNSLDNNNNNNLAGSRPGKTNRNVSTVYDPISGRLVTSRGLKPGSENREPESSDGSDGDVYAERTYGSVVRRENLGGGGGDNGLGLGFSNVNGNNEDVFKERSYGSTVRRENFGGGRGEKGLGSSYGNRKKGGKNKVAWVCSSCGHSDGQWWGTCRACSSMGTVVKFVEGVYDEGKTSGFQLSENVIRTWLPNQGTETVPLRLTDVNRGVNQTEWRIPLPSLFGAEVARVLGGGLVPGSLVLVGGDPGVGKSTLLLQIAAIIAEGQAFGQPAPVIYVSGEESVEQIGNRADRMMIQTEELFLYSSTDIEDVFEKIQHLSPRALVIDSIQTVYLKGVTGSAGGLQQVKECTSALLRFAKKTNIPVLLIGHVTKTGDIAGPRVLEHIVDVVLYMEGEKLSSHRLLRSVKNRYGSTDELGVFEMSQLGLQAVSNPSEMFLSEQQSDSEVLAGLAVAAMMDGSRTFLIEIQALCVSGSSFSRQVNGVQASRADMIISVLKKQAGLKLHENIGIYLNVVSGVTLQETAGDLAIAAAICSSFLEFPIPNTTAFIGEIGLGGELRPVPRMEKRVNTVAKLGYKKCIVPESAGKSLAGLAIEGTTIVSCKNLKEMIHSVFTAA